MGTLINVPMSNLVRAIEIIRKYEGFNEKSYPDPETGTAPYTFGYGTQFYPDGSPVKQGHYCTKEKALDYLLHEVNCIDDDLNDLHLNIDSAMRAALISFIHSIGWKPFLYSAIIDCIEQENWSGVIDEMNLWVFDQDRRVVGNLLERRREEAALFSQFFNVCSFTTGHTLLAAFREYSATPNQIEAIKQLETKINPYILAEFANSFNLENPVWLEMPEEDF